MKDLNGTEYSLKNFIKRSAGKKIVIFGAGKMGMYIYNKLLSNEISVYGICDNNEQKLEEIETKYPVKHLAELKNNIKKLYFIIAVVKVEIQVEIKRQLLKNGVKNSQIIIPYDDDSFFDVSHVNWKYYNIPYLCNRLLRRADTFFLNFFRKFITTKSNYIVFESEGDFTDNAKVFYDYMIKNHYNRKFHIIWLVHEPSKYKKRKNVIFVSRWEKINIKADYYIACSRFFIFTHPYWLENWKPDQIVINTTHSVAQLKYGYNNKNIFDYILSCSEYCTSVKMKVYDINEKKTICIGMPRIDILFHKYPNLKFKFTHNKEKRVILSMETFKQSIFLGNDSTITDEFAINVVHNMDEILDLDKYLGTINSVMIVKIHHIQNMSYIKECKLDNIIYIEDSFLHKNNIVTNHLLSIADVLLTDYSSVFYDYLVLDRPIGFLISDIDSYQRGFLMDNPLSEMPGEKIYNLSQLKVFLSNALDAKDTFTEKRRKIRGKVFEYNDDKNCERLMKWILENKGEKL